MRARSAVLLLVALFLSSRVAHAQDAPRYEVAGGYAFMHDQDSSYNFRRGWVVSFAAAATDWLGLVGEAGGSFKTLSIPGDPPKFKVYTFMGGPRFTPCRDRRIAPFAQVLFGRARASTTVLDVSDTVTDFAYQPGGGVDLSLSRNVAIRVEGDYRIIRVDGSNSKESRFVAAAVFGFGH